MNPNYGYQLYQAERPMTRAEILAGDAQRGRSAAAAARRRGRGTGRGTGRKARGRGVMGLGIMAARIGDVLAG